MRKSYHQAVNQSINQSIKSITDFQRG